MRDRSCRIVPPSSMMFWIVAGIFSTSMTSTMDPCAGWAFPSKAPPTFPDSKNQYAVPGWFSFAGPAKDFLEERLRPRQIRCRYDDVAKRGCSFNLLHNEYSLQRSLFRFLELQLGEVHLSFREDMNRKDASAGGKGEFHECRHDIPVVPLPPREWLSTIK